jgi:hypothetical protein
LFSILSGISTRTRWVRLFSILNEYLPSQDGLSCSIFSVEYQQEPDGFGCLLISH